MPFPTSKKTSIEAGVFADKLIIGRVIVNMQHHKIADMYKASGKLFIFVLLWVILMVLLGI